jgi:hypothetical protein
MKFRENQFGGYPVITASHRGGLGSIPGVFVQILSANRPEPNATTRSLHSTRRISDGGLKRKTATFL